MAVHAFGQAFGRFGYRQEGRLPGLKVDSSGFGSNDQMSEKILFPAPSTIWRPISTESSDQIVQLTEQKGGPSRIDLNLYGLGFSLYFPTGINLKVKSTGAPYLSWEQGSVMENVPTPSVKWLLLSFHDRQPPIVLGFVGGTASLVVSGSPGAWAIRSTAEFKGWVRVVLPEGIKPELANTPGALGRLAEAVAKNASEWTGPAPKLVKLDIQSDLYSVTANWQFDRPGAVVPPPAMLANLGNYLLSVKTPTRRLPGWTDEGPIDIVDGTNLTIRFPIKRIPTGRSLAVGTYNANAIGTVSSLDVPGVAELALEELVAGRDELTKRTAIETTNQFINDATFSLEPWTKQQLPYDAEGKGLDIAAAEALLSQAITSSSKSTSDTNSMLTSVSWRQDWLTWRVWTPDNKIAQRAGALMAIAGALCPEPERRLAGAMFQAGLSGLRGLDVWRRREGIIAAEPKLIEPFYGVRKGIFGLEGPTEDGEAFAASLLSPLRVFSEQPLTLVQQGADFLLEWPVVDAKGSTLTLASEYPIDVAAQANLPKFKAVSALGFTEIQYTPEAAGQCQAQIGIPAYAKPPPSIAPIPPYVEAER